MKFFIIIFLIFINLINCKLNNSKLNSKYDLIDYTTMKNKLLSLEVVKHLYLASIHYDERINSLIGIAYNYVIPKLIKNITECEIKYEQSTEKCEVKYDTKVNEFDNNIYLIIKVEIEKEPRILSLNNYEIPLRKIDYSTAKRNKITLCISKMVKYDCPYSFVQMIESNRYFGVDHATVYVTSCSMRMKKVLDYYMKEGFLDLIGWNNTIEKMDKINGYNQRVKINDCFYRNRKNTDMLLNTDNDEILWPVKMESYTQMFKRIDKKGIYDEFSLRERVFKRGETKSFDRYTHDIKDTNYFQYREYANYTWKFPKWLIHKLDNIKSLSVHKVFSTIKLMKTKKIDYDNCFIRHTRRIMPYYNKRLELPWKTYPEDKREEIILKRVDAIIEKLKLMKPKENE